MSDIVIIRQIEAKLGFTLKQVTPEAITQKEKWGYLEGLRAYALDEQGRVKGLSLDYLYAASDLIQYFSRLKQMTSLSLRGFNGEDYTFLANLIQLTALDLCFSKLNDLKVLKDLKNLTTLNLSRTKVSVLTSLKELRNLITLDLSRTKVSNLSVLKELKNLTTLYLGGTNASVLTALKELKNLTILHLDGINTIDLTDLQDLKNLTALDLSETYVYNLEVLNNLKNLTHLDLRRAQVNSLMVLRNLRNLTMLDLSYTEVFDFTILKDLKNLTKLFLNGTYIRDLTILKDLKNLTTLDLIETKVSDLSPLADLPGLYELRVSSEKISNPPPEIAAQGWSKIRNYFRQLTAQGEERLYEAKLLIVGEGGAGKTTLAKKIMDSSYKLDNQETSTEGIEVLQWRFETPDHHSFRANIWDFGGQEIYHATHQFFLSKRSLYLLVADTRKEDTDFFYWLNVVELLSDNSPLLIIKNEKQDRHRDINERQLRSRFINLKETLATNLANNRGLEKVLAEIQHHLFQLPLVGTVLPKAWVKVRETLEQDLRNFIPLLEYYEICDRHGFTITADKLQLSGYLHDIGVCLHFQDDPLLRKIVILKPKWGTDAVYRVLDNKSVIRNLGRFSRADLEHFWTEPEYAEMLDELLQLMIKFKLCYRLSSSTDQYIAPQLLSENQPEYEWNDKGNLYLRYRYEFMPKGILTQFIVMIHTMILNENCVWKSGVVMVKDNTYAEVIEDYHHREIRIRVSGKHQRDLIGIVTYELERIHSSFSQLKCSKHIPCNCHSCQITTQPNFYPFDVLQRFMGDQRDIQCQQSYEMVNPRQLIDDISGKTTGFDRVQQRDKVFISYSHKDRIWLEKLLTMLKPLTRNETLSLWADTEIRAGDRWREEIRQALDTAKVAVLLVSPNFLASDFITENELPPILKAAEDRELVILWIPISACLYKKTTIADYQGAMDPANPLDSLSEAGASKALVGICEQISEAMNR